MADKKEGLERLCQVYEALDEDEKGEVIKYAEGLLISLEKNNAKLKSKKGNRQNDALKSNLIIGGVVCLL